MITWTQQSLPTTSWVLYDNSGAQSPTGRLLFGAYLGSSEHVLTSDDYGATLVQRAVPAGVYGPDSILAKGGVIVAIAGSAAGDNYALYSTDDGNTWATARSDFATVSFLLHDGAQFIALASGAFQYRSSDGIAWTNNPPLTAGILQAGVASGGTTLIADGSAIFRSADAGQSWMAKYSGAVYGLHIRGGTAFACGNNGLLLVSYDLGETWSTKTSGTTKALRYFAQNGDVILCSGIDGAIIRSEDAGETWAALTPWATSEIVKVQASKGAFFGCLESSNGASPRYSTDNGQTWVALPGASYVSGFLQTAEGAVALGTISDEDKYWTAEFSLLAISATGAFSLPALSVFGGQGLTVRGAFDLPAITVSATGAEDPRYVYALDYATTSSVSPTSSGLIAALALSNASAVFTTEVDALVAATAISSALAASVLASQTIAGATAISLVWLDVAQHETTPADVWAMNTETGGFTRYEGFDFNSYAKIGGAYFGCKEDGIYQLDGQTDVGAPIRSMVSFGKQDFGSSALKRITNAYVGVSGEGRLFLKVMGEGQEYTYAARSYDEALQVQRFDTGKGLRVNWLEFELYNADGEDFELASVEFAVVPTSRRI